VTAPKAASTQTSSIYIMDPMFHKLLDIDPDQIRVSPESIISLLGGKDQSSDHHTWGIIEYLVKECSGVMEPRCGYAVAKAIQNESDEEISIPGTRFSTGKIIRKMLQGAESYVFFIATAGPGPEKISRSLIDQGQYLEGYIADLIGSAMAESVAHILHEQVRKEAIKDRAGVTNRYSPGYCGWDVGEQHKLFDLFPEGCCGVTLSGSSLMLPIKSVSGVIGTGASVSYRDYTCEICSMKACIFRRTRSFTPPVQ
jgi:hypothetical protein